MSSEGERDRSSPFDRMLAENRRQFDTLLDKRPKDRLRSKHEEPAAPSAPAPSPKASADDRPAAVARKISPLPLTSDATSDGAFDIRKTDIGRDLAGRFGDRWRFDIVDKRRDGTDVVVWGRLVVEERGHDKTRRGRARIRNSVEDAPIAAQADGSAFRVHVDGTTAAIAGDPEGIAPEIAAYSQATMLALFACAKGL